MFVNPLSLVLCNIPETHPSKSLQILKSKARIPSQLPLNTDSLTFFFHADPAHSLDYHTEIEGADAFAIPIEYSVLTWGLPGGVASFLARLAKGLILLEEVFTPK